MIFYFTVIGVIGFEVFIVHVEIITIFFAQWYFKRVSNCYQSNKDNYVFIDGVFCFLSGLECHVIRFPREFIIVIVQMNFKKSAKPIVDVKDNQYSKELFQNIKSAP